MPRFSGVHKVAVSSGGSLRHLYLCRRWALLENKLVYKDYLDKRGEGEGTNHELTSGIHPKKEIAPGILRNYTLLALVKYRYWQYVLDNCKSENENNAAHIDTF